MLPHALARAAAADERHRVPGRRQRLRLAPRAQVDLERRVLVHDHDVRWLIAHRLPRGREPRRGRSARQELGVARSSPRSRTHAAGGRGRPARAPRHAARSRASAASASPSPPGRSGGRGRRSRRRRPTSRTPPTPVATTGRATDIASSTVIGSASTALVRHRTSAACMTSRASARYPRHAHAPPLRAAARSTASASGPSPTTIPRTAGSARVRGGDLLDERARPLLGPKRRHEHGQERARVDAELGSQRRAVAHGRIVGDAVRDHPDRIAAGSRRGRGARAGSRRRRRRRSPAAARAEQQPLVRRSGRTPSGSGPRCSVTTWAARCRRASAWPTRCALTPRLTTARGARPGQPQRAGEPGRVGAVAQARARDRDAAGAQLVEVGAAAVERDHADVEAALGEAGTSSPTAARRPPASRFGQTNTTLGRCAPLIAACRPASTRRYTARTRSAIGRRP